MHQEDDYNPDLARWLEDSGRRQAIRLKESPEELLTYLEELSNQKLSSREDILRYFKALQAQEAANREARRKRRTVRHAILTACLAVAIAQCYYWSVYRQIMSLQKVYYFTAPTAADGRF